MAVTLKMQKDGRTFRPCWYGVYESDNKRRVVNLGIRWRGTPPASGSLRDAGDEAFEKSREKAEEALSKFRDEAARKGNAAHLVERLIEAKTGRAVSHVRIDELAERWRNVGRRARPSPVYIQACDALFRRFGDFMRSRNPAAVYLYEVTSDDAAIFAGLCRDSLATATATSQIQRLRSSFARLLPPGVMNPFADVVMKGGDEAIHRRPFSPEELRAILDTARADEFLYPLVVTAACTGMRRGDVCCLRWDAVDLDGAMLAVKTSKSGRRVEIPIFAPLLAVLKARIGNGGKFVFPEAEAMLRENPSGLTYRFKKLLVEALDAAPATPDGAEPTAPAEVEAEALAAIREHVRPGPKRERMLEAMRLYAAGQSYRDIERATGMPRPTLSGYFQEIGQMIGCQFIRGAHKATGYKSAIARVTREAREQGRNAASVRDWHTMRATWVTLALTAGVPMELVRRVTGHATADIVLRHYFQPGKAAFKDALVSAMPEVLTGRAAPRQITAALVKANPKQELSDLAAKLATGTATKAERARFKKLAAKV